MMRLMSVLMLTIFSFNAFAVPMNSANKEKQGKKRIAQFVAQVKSTTDVEKKEEMLRDFLTAFDKRVLSQDTSKMSEEEVEEVVTLKENLLGGFEMVKGGSAADLNAYAEYLESEMNQASVLVVFYYILLICAIYYGGYGFAIVIRI